jgi:hypothetical protein
MVSSFLACLLCLTLHGGIHTRVTSRVTSRVAYTRLQRTSPLFTGVAWKANPRNFAPTEFSERRSTKLEPGCAGEYDVFVT